MFIRASGAVSDPKNFSFVSLFRLLPITPFSHKGKSLLPRRPQGPFQKGIFGFMASLSGYKALLPLNGLSDMDNDLSQYPFLDGGSGGALRVKMAIHVPKVRLTSAAAVGRTHLIRTFYLQSKSVKTESFITRLHSAPSWVHCWAAHTGTGESSRKESMPSAHPSHPKKTNLERAPAGSRPARCHPPAHTAEPDSGPGDKCSCVNKKPPEYK